MRHGQRQQTDCLRCGKLIGKVVADENDIVAPRWYHVVDNPETGTVNQIEPKCWPNSSDPIMSAALAFGPIPDKEIEEHHSEMDDLDDLLDGIEVPVDSDS